ncbi:uncharacterized protein F5Z01DRAFT_447565 [Emericellopsis atlantica]|uniref:BTB domain-containing protein n=1 Tax=Emericellopsis atlantica TaxID=2614577 RepID=A0A9P7ZSJ3_9HYPO|nr:uncharacterized protein F5Z01DRAFT_447565 [Emericellopsis atlantica]KAG9257016.1 hypothetical protein F5Z01DRAFT_447565 [Emericellopsis atlantica]
MPPGRHAASRASSSNNGDAKAPQKREPSRASSSNNGDPKAPQRRQPSRSRNAARSEPLSILESSRMSRLQPAPIPRINPWLQGLKLGAKVEPSQPIPAHLEEESPLPSASRKRSRPATSKKRSEKGEPSVASGSPEGTANVPECPNAPRSTSRSPTDILRHHSRSPTLSQTTTAEPVSLEEINRSTRSPSTSSEASRSALIAAASRAESNLFANPIGADVLVCAGNWSWKVHRNILVRESDWFKDNLPKLQKGEDLIKISFECAPETLGYCIRFMYMQKVEGLLEAKPFDVSHLPRCVLCYCAALYFRTKGMIPPILGIVDATAKDLCEDLSGLHLNNNGVSTTALPLNETHLLDALDLIYSQENQVIMEPMRIAMVAVLDATLFFQLHRDAFMEKLRAYPWISRMQTDYAEFRRQTGFSRQGLLIPSGEALDTILAHPDLKHTANIEI